MVGLDDSAAIGMACLPVIGERSPHRPEADCHARRMA